MKKTLMIMAALFCGMACKSTAGYPTDVIETGGGELKILFFGHASLAFEFSGTHIYVDPVSEYADYAALPKADLILVGHEHGDHLDPGAIDALSKPGTLIIGNATAVEKLGRGEILEYGTGWNYVPAEGERRSAPLFTIDAVPAYNTSPEKQNFHPAASRHNGYILDFGGTRVYVAGDGEDTPEMVALDGIDIAFLPVNLPYTMTEEQAARAAKAIRPKILYPYHYGGTDHKTDLEKLKKLLEGSGIDVRIRPME